MNSRGVSRASLCATTRDGVAVFGNYEIMQTDPHWRDNLLFHEYFHGDNGSGRGASHQTGWTGLIAKVLQQARR